MSLSRYFQPKPKRVRTDDNNNNETLLSLVRQHDNNNYTGDYDNNKSNKKKNEVIVIDSDDEDNGNNDQVSNNNVDHNNLLGEEIMVMKEHEGVMKDSLTKKNNDDDPIIHNEEKDNNFTNHENTDDTSTDDELQVRVVVSDDNNNNINNKTIEIDDKVEGKSTKVNRFAKFAFSSSSLTNNNQKQQQQRPLVRTNITMIDERNNNNNKIRSSPNKFKNNNNNKEKNNNNCTSKNKWVRVRDLNKDEQENIINKWHTMIINNQDTDIENKRFQILIATLLHARCQESVVRDAMYRLNKTINGITILTLANIQIEDATTILYEPLKKLQYHNMKAKYIVQVSKQIQENFNNIVPEQEDELRKLNGVGPVFADLLSFVNTRYIHEKMI